MVKKYHVDSDRKANPALKQEMGALRGGMLDQVFKSPLPERFEQSVCESSPGVIIRDKQTGREVNIPLFAAREVRDALNGLFGR